MANGHISDEHEHEHEHKSATDWWGPDDKANPQNWSTGKKIFHTIVPPSVGFLCPFGSSVYSPGNKQVQSEFNVSREIALLPFVFYLLGLSFGPILASPTSEQYGRKIVYMSSLPIFAAFTVGAGFSQGIVSLIVCRFFAGLFSSPGLSIGTGTISDIWPPEKRGAPMSIFIFMVQMGPALGPVIGGFVVETRGWRWTQWVICFGIVVVFAVSRTMVAGSRTLGELTNEHSDYIGHVRDIQESDIAAKSEEIGYCRPGAAGSQSLADGPLLCYKGR